ncbi:hypothetical protein [Sphingomonas oleivorans]|uniref:hypothetical protein n=1 Tax=Sphingomonas oleivorans TaxID=1735121 RepID=UPI001A9D50DE|nr:hypothetical protein [Sphingomonas oleivorans]
MKRLAFLILLAATAPAIAAPKPPKIPKDAPFCMAPDAKLLFLSPMGEPFRIEQGRPYPSADWFAGADADRDGRVTAGEFVADASRFFKRIDKDGDAQIVPEEVIAYERDMAPEIALYAQRPDASYGGGMGAGRWAWLNIPEPVSSTDADLDRAISLAEYLNAARRRFTLLDQGGRGWLALDDLPRTPAQERALMPCRPRPAETSPTAPPK